MAMETVPVRKITNIDREIMELDMVARNNEKCLVE